MATACVFCIGTGHNHTEDTNVLVQLWQNCGFRDLGVEGNHTGDLPRRHVSAPKTGSTEGRALRIASPANVHSRDGGWTWINEGQNLHGGGMHQQVLANVALIRDLWPRPRHVVLLGHSRGAALCVGIASALHRELGATPRCHLFLYDPVKRLKATSGSSADYKQVHGNVERVRVIVMEDEGSSVAFPLMVVDGLPPQSYLRLPGTHGTATQCTGHPIGQLGFMLAMEWLLSGSDARVQMYAGRQLSDAAFCREYARVNIVNPLANGMRLINDAGKRVTFDAAVTFKEHAAGARALDAVAGPNVFSGTGFFVNDDHARRFNKAYPGALATAAAMATGAPATGVGRESLAQLRSYDRQGFDFFMRYMHVPYTNVRL